MKSRESLPCLGLRIPVGSGCVVEVSEPGAAKVVVVHSDFGRVLAVPILQEIEGTPHREAAEARADDLLSPAAWATLADGPGAQTSLQESNQVSAKVEASGAVHTMPSGS